MILCLRTYRKKAIVICKHNSNNNRGDETLFKINIVIRRKLRKYLKIWFLTILSIRTYCTRVRELCDLRKISRQVKDKFN